MKEIIKVCIFTLVILSLLYIPLFFHYLYIPARNSYLIDCNLIQINYENNSGIKVAGFYNSSDNQIYISTELNPIEKRVAISHERCHRFWRENIFATTCDKPSWIIIEEISCYFTGYTQIK